LKTLATIPREIELKLRPSLYRASSLSTVTPEQAALSAKSQIFRRRLFQRVQAIFAGHNNREGPLT
jgi:hypothetical protein